MQHNCIICARTATKRYSVTWTSPQRMDVAEYCICDRTHCYNVLYSLVDDHHHMIGSKCYILVPIDVDVGNDDPFGEW